MNGAHALIESLLREQVDHIFGYAGATICPVVDALKEHPEIGYTLVRTEQNAGHMASGYARVSGKVGVCMVTSGPGATNLITGIATAYMDSIPMVAITGQVPSPSDKPKGCAFAGRCRYASERCREEEPCLREAAPGHCVACHMV